MALASVLWIGRMDSENSSSDGLWRGLWTGPLALYRIRLGQGVLGRLTTNLIAILSVFGCAAVISLFLGQTLVAIGCLGVCGLAYLVNHISTMMFAYENPTAALLEGADLVRAQEISMASRDLPSPGYQPNIDAPVIEATEADADRIRLEHKVGEV
jgi:hypothetical protein